MHFAPNDQKHAISLSSCCQLAAFKSLTCLALLAIDTTLPRSETVVLALSGVAVGAVAAGPAAGGWLVPAVPAAAMPPLPGLGVICCQMQGWVVLVASCHTAVWAWAGGGVTPDV
jgi:hypothetical protein